MDQAAQLQQVYQEIISRAPEHDIDPTLQRVADVLDLLGNPQRAYRIIHITGTNGKTSTARMAESVLGELGLRVGRFTSPHLTSVTERISVDGESLSDERFVEVYQDVLPYIEMVDHKSQSAGGPRLSFFEVLTVMAFAAFADTPVDVAVVEVGMGGRWDSTNVADADIAVITPIAIDHVQWLGSTVGEIANEKAGIIKPGCTVVVGQQDEVATGIILSAAAQQGAKVLRAGEELEVVSRAVAVGGQMISLRTEGGTYTDIYLPLHGEHQSQNALLALAAVEQLAATGATLSPEVVEQGFGAATSPGRLELVRTSPSILVDGAHNPAGAQALVAALGESFAYQRIIGVVGVMADKAVEEVLGILEPIFDEIVVTQALSERALDTDELAKVANEVFGADRVHAVANLADAIDQAATLAESDGTPGSGIVITGSLLTVAQARILLSVS